MCANAATVVVLILPEKNLIAYKNFTFEEKVDFSRNGYTFENDPGNPAIKMNARVIKTNSEGDRGGIFAGSTLPYFPGDIKSLSQTLRTNHFYTKSLSLFVDTFQCTPSLR